MITLTELKELADIIWPNDTSVNFDYLINDPKRAGYAAALMKNLINSHKKQIIALGKDIKKHNGIAQRKICRLTKANEVLIRVKKGDTYDQIGEELGFSRQNVSQLVNKYQNK